jgi:D-alanyl-D-alanine carboxypeptidase
VSLGQQQRLFTKLVARLIIWAYEQGYALSFGEAYRTEEQQRWYVESGASHTMHSQHRARLAIDLNLFINGEYQRDSEAYRPLGDYWRALHPGCVWGGDWETLKDGNHFEFKELEIT